MSARIRMCVCAVSAVLFLTGGITLSSVRVESMQVGGAAVDGKWKASSPTVQSDSGEYLAYEAAGDSPRVYFTKDKGPHTSWAFVDRQPFSDHHLAHEQGRPGWVSVEEEGFTLRLRATEGTFRGWYLSRTKAGKLELTKEVGPATEVKILLKRTRSVGR
jgi:hypothetical protein